MLTIKTNYKKTLSKVTDMLKHVYPDKTKHQTNERLPAQILHNNISTYSQTLMSVHEANLVQDT